MYSINGKVLELVLNYLAKQPYAEVSRLIDALRSCTKIEEKEEKEGE